MYAKITQFKRVSDLNAALTATWDAFPNATLLSPVFSTPFRCIEVAEKKSIDFYLLHTASLLLLIFILTMCLLICIVYMSQWPNRLLICMASTLAYRNR